MGIATSHTATTRKNFPFGQKQLDLVAPHLPRGITLLLLPLCAVIAALTIGLLWDLPQSIESKAA